MRKHHNDNTALQQHTVGICLTTLKFGNRVITTEGEKTRATIQGVQRGILDMWVSLQYTQHMHTHTQHIHAQCAHKAPNHNIK